MSKIAQATCPGCQTKGTLSIVMKMVAMPIGGFSLAGTQPKVTARELPVLVCSDANCTFNVIGRIEAGKAVFDAGASA